MANKITRPIKKEELAPRWVIVDADNVRIGKLITKVASLLIGKTNVKQVDFMESGDNVIIINASKLAFYPSKLINKVYPSHSGYPGGYNELKFKDLIVTRPEFILNQAIWGMLPKNKIGRKLLKNVHIFNGSEHTFEAQKPIKV
jgi:large subunit ribosomal protein L13